MSVSVEVLSLGSLCLFLRPHVDLVSLSVGGLGHCHGGPLGLDTRGPGSNDLWVSVGVGKRSA